MEIQNIKNYPHKYKGFFDGSSKGNPGPAQCGWALLDFDDNVIDHASRKSTENRTNNYAEYAGLIELLNYLIERPRIEDVEIFGDSKLVVEQVNGRWKCKSVNIKHLHKLASDKFKDLKATRKITISWIPREKNTIADSLAQKGILL